MTATAGEIRAGCHHFPVRVYYEDTDAGGVVYHSRYLNYAERARTELLRLIGIEQSSLLSDHGLVFAIRDCRVDYRRPARLDDLLDVRTRLTRLRGASIDAVQEIWRATQRLVSLDLRVAAIRAKDGRPTGIPAGLRATLKAYVQPSMED